MIAVSKSHIYDQIIAYRDDVARIIMKAKDEITELMAKPLLKDEESFYLEFLGSNLDTIVKASPDELNYFRRCFGEIISCEKMGRDHATFRNELIRRLGYKGLRESFYPRFFKNIPINACVYCNSQLAITAKTKNGKRIAKFQVDHFLPKSEYPCFSISFFNLFPVCQPCNGRKSAKPMIFDLYSDDPEKLKKSPYQFRLERSSISKYRTSGDKENLEIRLEGADSRTYAEFFDIDGIYATQKDMAEELVLMSIVYDKAYLKSLQNSFERLYPLKAPMASRLFLSTYTEESDIHKRPMSKFRQDIARQLGLID